MKVIGILLLCTLSLAAFAQRPGRVSLMTGKLFVPEGFDDNDLVEVTVSGLLPDTCHRNPGHDVYRRDQEIHIELYAYWVPEPEGCRRRSTPYTEVINLGMLKSGTYQLSLGGVEVTSSELLRISEAKGLSQDDFRYGNVTGIREIPGKREIELLGTNPVDCLRPVGLESEVQGNVIVLRPIFDERGPCRQGPTPFGLRYKVPKAAEDLLLHIRVMDGRSFNYLYRRRR
jgi:hypothetical protein